MEGTPVTSKEKLAFETRSIAKRLESIPLPEVGNHPPIELVFGSLLHARIAQSPYICEYYSNFSRRRPQMAEQLASGFNFVHEAVEQRLAPPEGKTAYVMHEVSLMITPTIVKTVEQIKAAYQEGLLLEEELITAIVHPETLHDLMISSNTLEGMDESQIARRQELENEMEALRVYRYSRKNHLIYPPSARPDRVSLLCNTDDEYAKKRLARLRSLFLKDRQRSRFLLNHKDVLQDTIEQDGETIDGATVVDDVRKLFTENGPDGEPRAYVEIDEFKCSFGISRRNGNSSLSHEGSDVFLDYSYANDMAATLLPGNRFLQQIAPDLLSRKYFNRFRAKLVHINFSLVPPNFEGKPDMFQIEAPNLEDIAISEPIIYDWRTIFNEWHKREVAINTMVRNPDQKNLQLVTY